MYIRALLMLTCMSLFLSGCASTPQQPIQFNSVSVVSTEKIGVAMTALPKVDTYFPGADCLLCLATASMANSSLTTHAHTLPYEDLPKIKEQVAELIKKKGGNAVVITDDIALNSLADYSSKDVNFAKKNFAPLAKKYSITKLVVINITSLGFIRTYASYFATSDPKAVIKGEGYLVNLQTNAYEWFMPFDIKKGTDSNWDEPQFPGLTNAYFQVIELGKDSLTKPLIN